MKKFLVSLVAIALSIATFAGSKNPSFIESFGVSGDCELHLLASNGSLAVYPGEVDEISIEFYVQKGNKKMDISLAELREFKEVVILQYKNYVSVSIKDKNNVARSKKYKVGMIAYVPQNTSATLAARNGSITLKGLHGNQSLATSGGSISITEVIGEVKGNTMGGSAKCSNVEGPVVLRTSGGDLELDGIKGSIKAATSGGHLRFNAVNDSTMVTDTKGSYTAVDSSMSITDFDMF